MLLRLEPEIERERLDGGVREQKILKYDGLRRRIVGLGKAQRVVDIIVCQSRPSDQSYGCGKNQAWTLEHDLTRSIILLSAVWSSIGHRLVFFSDL
jgi:hypothetical protein